MNEFQNKIVTSIIKKGATDNEIVICPIGVFSNNVIIGGTWKEIGSPKTLNDAISSILNYVEKESLDGWVYENSSGEYLAHIANSGSDWENDGDIILYPQVGGATFGTTSRSAGYKTDVNTIVQSIQDDTKGLNSFEIGSKNAVYADNAMALGSDNTISKDHNNTLVVGSNNSSTRPNQVLIGENIKDVQVVYKKYNPGTTTNFYESLNIFNEDNEENSKGITEFTYNGGGLIFAIGNGDEPDGNNSNNALEIYDNDSNQSGDMPSSLIHTSGDIFVEGDFVGNSIYAQEKVYAKDLYITNDIYLKSDVDINGDGEEDVTVSLSKDLLEQLSNIEKKYPTHKHSIENFSAKIPVVRVINYNIQETSSSIPTTLKQTAFSLPQKQYIDFSVMDTVFKNAGGTASFQFKRGSSNIVKTTMAQKNYPIEKLEYTYDVSGLTKVIHFNIKLTLNRYNAKYGIDKAGKKKLCKINIPGVQFISRTLSISLQTEKVPSITKCEIDADGVITLSLTNKKKSKTLALPAISDDITNVNSVDTLKQFIDEGSWDAGEIMIEGSVPFYVMDLEKFNNIDTDITNDFFCIRGGDGIIQDDGNGNYSISIGSSDNVETSIPKQA